jgi:hypothetical protein
VSVCLKCLIGVPLESTMPIFPAELIFPPIGPYKCRRLAYQIQLLYKQVLVMTVAEILTTIKRKKRTA